MHVFHDFRPDGYVIFQTRDVIRTRRSVHERVWQDVLSAQGSISGIDKAPKVDLTAMGTALKSIQESGRMVIVQCEDRSKKKEDFYIGYLESGRWIVRMRYFSANGRWYARLARISLMDITKLQLDTPYIKVWQRYLRAREKKKS